MNREHYAETLKEGAITVWVDTDTPFGYGALEAMRCNNIVIGKLPEHIQEWMLNDEGEIIDNAIWFDSFDQLPDILADVIASWMQDEVPQVLYDNMAKTNLRYTQEEWNKNVEKLADNLVLTRIREFDEIYHLTQQNINNKEDNTEEK